jgi:phosphate transport system permease protein
MAIESLDATRHIRPARFLGDPGWHPTKNSFNLLPMILGSLLVMLGAVGLATPLGLLSAIFCHYLAPTPLANLYRRTLELLIGVPGVVFGLWGLTVLVPWIQSYRPPGTSLLAGILILAILILPGLAISMEAALDSVPPELLEAGAALGLTREATILRIALPTARGGILTGVLLQVGRALGETMAVLMVSGNVARLPESLFAPVRTLTANIALEMGYAMGDHRSALYVSGSILLGVVVAVVATGHLLFREEAHD